METSVKKNGNTVAIVTMFFVFAMISFVTNMAAPFGNIWGFRYAWAGMAGNLMNFTAYLFMGIPAGNMLIRYGYKKTTLIALAVGAIGLGIQLLSSVVGDNIIVIGGEAPTTLNLFIYLLGALVCGVCVCMLNTVVNPMLNLLGGGGNKGNQLIQTGGALNSLAGTLTPMMVGVLVGTLTKETTMASVAPLVVTGIVIFVAAFIVISFVKLQEPQANLSNVKYEHSPLAFRHCMLGIIAIFFYVGIEIGIPGVLIFWLSSLEGGSVAVAGAVAAVYWLLMLVGRFVSSIISGKVSSRAQLIFVSTLAIFLTAAAIFLPKDLTINMPAYQAGVGFSMYEVPISAMFLVLCGLCTSVMWGGIFNLAVEGLGKFTAQASGIFMMMVVGGGVMPLIQNWIAGEWGYMSSYWLIIAMFLYLLYYGCIGCKNVNGDIPVSDDQPFDERDL